MGAEELMRTVTAAFERSDLRPLLAALHDDIVWKSASRVGGPFSFQGAYRKREGVVEVLSNISRDYTFQSMTPREITAKGDTVWGLFDAAVRFDRKGTVAEPRTVALEIAIRWRLKDGKIVEHQAFFDTAYLLQQQGVL
jgi:ketosteroid isomerase-like protein